MSEQRRGVDNGTTYASYLLRLWRVSEGGETAWRASLEDPHTGERLGFAGFAELLSFLDVRTGGGLDPRTESGKNHHRPGSTRK